MRVGHVTVVRIGHGRWPQSRHECMRRSDKSRNTPQLGAVFSAGDMADEALDRRAITPGHERIVAGGNRQIRVGSESNSSAQDEQHAPGERSGNTRRRTGAAACVISSGKHCDGDREHEEDGRVLVGEGEPTDEGGHHRGRECALLKATGDGHKDGSREEVSEVVMIRLLLSSIPFLIVMASPFGSFSADLKKGKEAFIRGDYLKDTLTYYARRYYGREQTAQIVVGIGG